MSSLQGARGGAGVLPLRWHFLLSKSTASKGHMLIMLFTAVKIHIVEMPWHYYSSISSSAVIFTHWMSVNVKHWLGIERAMKSRRDTFNSGCDGYTEKEHLISLIIAWRLQIKQLLIPLTFSLSAPTDRGDNLRFLCNERNVFRETLSKSLKITDARSVCINQWSAFFTFHVVSLGPHVSGQKAKCMYLDVNLVPL